MKREKPKEYPYEIWRVKFACKCGDIGWVDMGEKSENRYPCRYWSDAEQAFVGCYLVEKDKEYGKG